MKDGMKSEQFKLILIYPFLMARAGGQTDEDFRVVL